MLPLQAHQNNGAATGPIIGRTCRVAASIVTGGCHVGARGLGMLGADIAASAGTGEHGPGLLANDSLLPDREYRLRISNSTFAPGALVVWEDGAVEFTATGTGTQTLYEGGAAQPTVGLNAGFDPPTVGVLPSMQLARTIPGFAGGYAATYSGVLAPLLQGMAFSALQGEFVPLGYVGVLGGMAIAHTMPVLGAGEYIEAWKAALKEYTLLAPVDQIDHLGGFAEKSPQARVTLAFEFKRFAPVPATCVVTLMQVRGPTDPAAQAVLEGAPAILGTKVYQRVKLGVAECDYRLTCLLEDQSGSAYVLRGLLPVRNG